MSISQDRYVEVSANGSPTDPQAAADLAAASQAGAVAGDIAGRAAGAEAGAAAGTEVAESAGAAAGAIAGEIAGTAAGTASGATAGAVAGAAAGGPAGAAAATALLAARAITGGGLATGGGTLDADRVITVTEASQAQAEAGTSGAVAMTPRRTVANLDAFRPQFSTVAAMLASTSTAFGVTGRTVQAGPFRYAVVASGEDLVTAGGVKLRVLLDADGRAAIEAFGAVFDGTNSTLAVQKAFASGLPLKGYGGVGVLLITDTLLCEYGVDYLGAGGVVLNTAAREEWRFEPPTKRNLFGWRVSPGTDYVFEGAKIRGFSVRGFGPGGDAVFELPGLYQGELAVDVYVGFDHYATVDKCLNTYYAGSITVPRVSGFEWTNAAGDGTGVSTYSLVDTYIAQGDCPAHIMGTFAVFDMTFRGVVESMATLFDAAEGNVFVWESGTENVPKTNTGAAFSLGKTGSAPAGVATGVAFRAAVAHGRNTPLEVDWANTTFADVGKCDYLSIEGTYIARFGKMFATTSQSKNITVIGGFTRGVTKFADVGAVADMTQFTFSGFAPELMLTPDALSFVRLGNASQTLELFPRQRAGITPGQTFTDATFANKLRYRDYYGNFSDPIPRLTVTGDSGWTVQGGALVPGETLRNSSVNLGEVGLWQSMRYSRDVAVSVGGGSTTSGSPTITNSAGAYNGLDVGDWVTASAGYPDTTTQVRILSKAANGSSVTLEFNATASVSGTVTLATEAHQLVPLAQQGFRQFAADPVGTIVPKFLGERLFRPDTSNWYVSVGLTLADWKLTT